MDQAAVFVVLLGVGAEQHEVLLEVVEIVILQVKERFLYLNFKNVGDKLQVKLKTKKRKTSFVPCRHRFC